jgi:HEAT repeat protein
LNNTQYIPIFFLFIFYGREIVSDGKESVMNELIGKLEDESPEVRLNSAKKLAEIGEEAVKPLINLLKSDDANLRKYSTFALKTMGSEKATVPLISALEDDDFSVRKFAAKALGDLNSNDAVDPLIDLLKDDDWGVRIAATKALGDIGNEKAVDPIKKARRAATGDKDYKKVANKSLKKIQK